MDEDVIIEWAHKLPAEAKAHISADKLPKDVEVANVSEDEGKGRKNATKNAKKKRKTEKQEVDDDFLPEEFDDTKKEFFKLLKDGEELVGMGGDKPTKSLKKLMQQVSTMHNIFFIYPFSYSL